MCITTIALLDETMLFGKSVEYAVLIGEKFERCIKLRNASLVQHQDSKRQQCYTQLTVHGVAKS